MLWKCPFKYIKTNELHYKIDFNKTKNTTTVIAHELFVQSKIIDWNESTCTSQTMWKSNISSVTCLHLDKSKNVIK